MGLWRVAGCLMWHAGLTLTLTLESWRLMGPTLFYPWIQSGQISGQGRDQSVAVGALESRFRHVTIKWFQWHLARNFLMLGYDYIGGLLCNSWAPQNLYNSLAHSIPSGSAELLRSAKDMGKKITIHHGSEQNCNVFMGQPLFP